MLMFIFDACTDFNDRFKYHFEPCKEAIQATNNKHEPKDATALLVYELIYQHMMPYRATNLDKVSLPSLCIKGQASRRENFILERLEA